jgi:hypothetical protein
VVGGLDVVAGIARPPGGETRRVASAMRFRELLQPARPKEAVAADASIGKPVI